MSRFTQLTKAKSHGHTRHLLTAKGICSGYWKKLVINTSCDHVISYKNKDSNSHEYLLLPYFVRCVSMCMCMFVCIYICVYTHTHIYNIHIYIDRYMCVGVCVSVCVCVYWLTDAKSRLIGKDSDARKD